MSWRTRVATVRRVGITQVVLARSWILLRGDERSRARLRVPPGGLVVDVGAFEGEFTAYARRAWDATVIAVEPVPDFAQALQDRFAADDRVTVVDAALGSSTGSTSMSVEADGSSAWGSGDTVITVPLIDVADVLDHLDVSLLKINAEGAEYAVLDRLTSTGGIQRIDTIQVQFHKFVPDARRRRKRIRSNLSRTHRCAWSVPWVWEQWQRRRGDGSRPSDG